MKVKFLLSGGVAEVSDEYGARLLAGPHWVSAEEPEKKKATRGRKPKAAPVEEPISEE